MSVHCLFCKAKSWKNCKDCVYALKIDKNTLLLVPSNIILKKDKTESELRK